MTAIYCDACVYRDFYQWRPGHAWIHYGEEAKKLLDRIVKKEFTLVVSDHLDYQLREFPQYQAYINQLREINNLIEVKCSHQDKERASDKAEGNPNTEFEDALHSELAIKGGATILATDNLEHFAVYENQIKIRRPEMVGLF